MRLFALLVLALCFPLSGSAQELEIKRPDPADKTLIPPGWVAKGDSLFEATYRVRPVLEWHDVDQSGPVSARHQLENRGVEFGEGASASFDTETNLLRVVNTPAQLNRVELRMAEGCFGEPRIQITVRTEIYELPTLQVLQLLESAQLETDHKPERDAALAAVREGGKARLVATHSVVTLNGLRAEVKDVAETLVPDEIIVGADPEDPGAKPSEPDTDETRITTDVRNYGTMLEVEPQVHPDGRTFWLNIVLEHHTAPPDLAAVTSKLKAPLFHAKKIATTVSMVDGHHVLIGTWKPTGRLEYEEKDLMHAVFVTARQLQLEPFGRVEPKKAAEPKKK